MAGRLNLRPIYGQDELTGGERIARGIGTALGEYAQHQEVGRQEESRRRAAGQVMTTRGEGGMDRLRSLGRRLLGRGDAGAGRVAPATGLVDNTLPPDNPVLGTSMAPSATPVPPAPMPRDGVSMGGVPVQRPAQPVPTVATSAVAPPPLMSQPQRGPRTIGTALDKYTEDDGFGNQWTVDPNRDANRRLAENNAELAQKDEFSERGTERSVEALTAAGMPRAEAEARVRTNTVRYDQEFGQQPRTTAMTFEQRQALAREHDERQAVIREKLARLSAAGRQNGPEALELRREALELSKQRLAMQQEQGQDRARAADVGRETTIGNAINSTLTKDPIAQSTMSPDQKAAEARRAADRDKHLNTAAQTQTQIRNSHATREQAQSRARALKAAGKSPAEIAATMQAEGYKVH